MGFSRQEYWCGLHFRLQGILLNPGIELVSSALTGRLFTTESLGKCRADVPSNHQGPLKKEGMPGVPPHHRIPKPTEKSQALVISLPNHAGLPSFLWRSCPPVWSMEDWREALLRAPKVPWIQSPWPCHSSTDPITLTCSIPKSTWGDGGPHALLCCSCTSAHTNPGQEE